MRAVLQKKIASLYEAGEWKSYRKYWRTRRDFQSFISANILAILSHCEITEERLRRQIEESRRHLRKYQMGHRACHWPVSGDRSMMPNAPLLGRLKAFSISPDADTTCLQQLALKDSRLVDPIVEDLSRYRVDGHRFRLPKFQEKLPGAHNTFLTWFPSFPNKKAPRAETIDLAVDANILWFLGENGRLNAPGVPETIKFVEAAVNSSLLLSDSFRLSIYYPFPAVILYLVSRSVAWGPVPALHSLRNRILDLAVKIEPGNEFERLCLAGAALFWKDAKLCRQIMGKLYETPVSGKSAFYVWPVLSSFLMKAASIHKIAARPAFQMKFQSPALPLAMQLYLIQELRR